jgi:hypothetical protein
MLFPSSGRNGFATIALTEDVKVPAKDAVKAMLRRENELRLSDSVQKALEKESAGEHVYEALQQQVAREFGYENEEEGVQVLRSAMSIYGDDPTIREIPLYVKYNRSEQGLLNVGDNIPDVALSTLNGSSVKLSDYMSASRPLVLVAGSYT